MNADFERIVSVLPDFENEALFVGGYSGTSMLLLRVIRNQITCSGLYSSCDDLAEGGWQDPLSCIWCPDEQRLAVTSSYDKLGCLHPITKTCPPVIDHANRNENHAEWEIFGSNMDRMQDVEVYVCDEKCTVNRQMSSSSKLLCSLPDGSDQDAACNVRVVGRLEGYSGFALEVKKTTHSVALMTERSQRSRTWKEIIAIVVVVIILAVLGVIICLARKKMRKKGIATVEITNSNVYDDAAMERYLNKLDHNLVDFVSPYEQMFRDIDERLKIDFSSLHIEEEIGRGVGDFITEGGVNRNGSDPHFYLVSLGLTMGRFNHPNLMQLVGIAFTEGKIPIITLRSLLRFACQIAEGMKHLHMCRSVHCDLAARNCMLDNNLNIKIGDFGLCRRVSDESEAYEPSNKHRDVPFPWMAPEAIISETFTFQNDVWAYGVVLWELTTRGLTPYGGKKGIEIMEFLRANRRLQMPEYCPVQLYVFLILTLCGLVV
ncbi:unnamed protein product [Strongylus vulgaris]|uniref:receptor protein-tyrosine kinase n=1 Tax=Strongylus vulgaris TaxID=40348 RepID=A0A3P7KY53_STRVU|nr:unnamed protein product [Strongylus vulgaris]